MAEFCQSIGKRKTFLQKQRLFNICPFFLGQGLPLIIKPARTKETAGGKIFNSLTLNIVLNIIPLWINRK